jgi:hypothetical protein
MHQSKEGRPIRVSRVIFQSTALIIPKITSATTLRCMEENAVMMQEILPNKGPKSLILQASIHHQKGSG